MASSKGQHPNKIVFGLVTVRVLLRIFEQNLKRTETVFKKHMQPSIDQTIPQIAYQQNRRCREYF